MNELLNVNVVCTSINTGSFSVSFIQKHDIYTSMWLLDWQVNKCT